MDEVLDGLRKGTEPVVRGLCAAVKRHWNLASSLDSPGSCLQQPFQTCSPSHGHCLVLFCNSAIQLGF